MNDNDITLLVTCDAAIVDDLRDALTGFDATVQTSPRRQLDGASAMSWLLAATVAIRTAPMLVNALREFLTRNNIRVIKIGDVSITNPRPEDVPMLLDAIHSHDQKD